MSAGHTPGPWKWDDTVWCYDKDQQAPWLVTDDKKETPVLTGEISCNEQDARLIAAAPELLAALTNYLQVMATAGGGDKQLFMAAIWQADDMARAAVSKATGEKNGD